MSSKYNTAITIRFTSEILDEIERLAKKSEASKASIIRQAVSKFIKEYK